MADYYLGINRGKLDQPGLVTAATTTSATDFELRIALAKGSTKLDVSRALEIFRTYMISNGVSGGAGTGTDLPPL